MESVPQQEWNYISKSEALYILEEDMNVKDISEAFWTVLGYYDAADNNIVVVTREVDWLRRRDNGSQAGSRPHRSAFPRGIVRFNLTDQAFAFQRSTGGDVDTVKDLYLRKFSTYYYELKEVKDNPVWIPIDFEFILFSLY